MASVVGLLELTSKHWAMHPIWICVIAPADCSAAPGPLGLDTPASWARVWRICTDTACCCAVWTWLTPWQSVRQLEI